MQNKKRYHIWGLLTVVILAALVLAPIQSVGAERPAADDPCLTVGAIYIGTVDDAGYNRAQHDGLVAMKENIPCVEFVEAENVPEGADAERTMEIMIRQGAGLIFATSFGHFEPVLAVAERHPDVIFMHAGGYMDPLPANVGTYYANMPESLYLMGVAAGRMTKTNHLGFVGAIPLGYTLGNINAFELGALSVNPDAQTHVVFTGSWVDRAAEAAATNALIAEDVDVVTMHVDSPITIIQTAEEAGIYSIGFQSVTAQEYAPEGWITGLGFTWGPVMTETAQAVIDGTWEPQNIRKGIYDGYMAVAPFGDFVPEEVQEEVLGLIDQLGSGDLVVFAGPIIDQDGEVRVPEGEQIPGYAMGDFDWFVQGVIGEPQ